MKIICDSGSTKADWVIISNNEKIYSCSTKGINPVFHDGDFIRNELSREIVSTIEVRAVEEIHFYGAGCWDANLKGIVKAGLQSIFVNANVFVDHDLLGAARAACGANPGIACILGTGSNSCLYDGDKVIDNVKNLGYLVGDEGSGSYIGKELLRCYFYRELPEELAEKFEKLVPGGKSEVLDKIYNAPGTPNVYLASFSKFLSDNKDHFFIQKLVSEAFEVFINRHVCKYEGHLSLPINFIGSVAFHYSNILKNVLNKKQMTMGSIVQKPIDSLVEFHLQNDLVAVKK